MRPENEWFRPEKLAKLWTVYTAIATVLVILPLGAGAAYLAMTADEIVPVAIGMVGAVGAVVLVLFLFWYVRAFERSAAYRLAPEEIQYRRGVWVKKESAVPYRRITNATTSQGPIQRWVDAGAVQIHTAGHSGEMSAELTVSGIPDYDDVNEQIMSKLRSTRLTGDEGDDVPSARETGDGDLLAEVRQIRELLENRA